MGQGGCPHCGASVRPGIVICKRCGYDFVTGRAPPTAGQERLRAAARFGVGGLLLAAVLGTGVWLTRRPPPPEDNHPCLSWLRAAQPAVLSARADHEVPRCGPTPPAGTDCWSLAGIGGDALPRSSALRIELRPRSSGFDLTCRTDLDQDGRDAIFQANEGLDGVRTSPAGVE